MKFLSEIKCRFVLIIINWIFIFNVGYYYKNVLLFLSFKYIIYNKTIEFYLIYTSISELFNLYLKVINFLTVNLCLYFLLYQIIVFINYGLYQNEKNIIKCLMFQFSLITTILVLLIMVYLFPLMWDFFEQFQKTFTFNMIHFEIKLNEYFLLILKTYISFKFCLLIFIVIVFIFKHYLTINKLKKMRKIINWCIFIGILTTFINDLCVQLFIYFLFIIWYELILFFLIYNKYYRIK